MRDLLALVPNEYLPQLEKYFAKIVDEIHTKVVRLDMHQAWQKQHDRDKVTMAILIKRTMRRIKDGVPRETAIVDGSYEPPYPEIYHLDHNIKMAEKKAEAAARAARNAKIVWLMKTGLKNAEIARKIGVSVSTVAKAIKQGAKK